MSQGVWHFVRHEQFYQTVVSVLPLFHLFYSLTTPNSFISSYIVVTDSANSAPWFFFVSWMIFSQGVWHFVSTSARLCRFAKQRTDPMIPEKWSQEPTPWYVVGCWMRKVVLQSLDSNFCHFCEAIKAFPNLPLMAGLFSICHPYQQRFYR